MSPGVGLVGTSLGTGVGRGVLEGGGGDGLGTGLGGGGDCAAQRPLVSKACIAALLLALEYAEISTLGGHQTGAEQMPGNKCCMFTILAF